MLRELIRLRRDGMLNVTGFMSDQKPSHGDPALPLMFLNRPTAFSNRHGRTCTAYGYGGGGVLGYVQDRSRIFMR